MKRRQVLFALTASALAARGWTQQPYPSKAITWVVGFPPGGGADGVTRLVAAKVSQNLGQPVVVENRPGASSIIAAQHVAQQPADGYTIFSAEQGALVFNAALYSKLPYDPARDFTPVTDMVRVPLLLVVHPSFPATDFRGFLDEVKQRPGKYHFGSPGRGLAHHLAMERLKATAKLDITDVQYKGIAPVIQDLVAGQIPMAAVDTVPLMQHLKSGKLRALAAFANQRLSVAPDVPALGELGYTDVQIAPIVGVVVPRNVPKDIVAKLNAEIVRALRDPEVNGKLSGLGLEVIGDTPEQFAAFLQAEGQRWLPFIRSQNIKLD